MGSPVARSAAQISGRANEEQDQPLLAVKNLQVTFHTPTGDVQALRGVDFTVGRGEIVGLVGETGCGKSVTGRSILRLIAPPGKITQGQIIFGGQDLLLLEERAVRMVRGKRIAMIFQNPGAALNPLFTVGQQLTAVMQQHGTAHRRELEAQALQLLSDVGLPDPERILNTYPHQLSGGMQQRAMIAVALSSDPELLVADEPTTSLDVTIQAQILQLLVKLQQSRGISIILITHDLAIVAETCHRVITLYAGRVAEEGSVQSIFRAPGHPYTQALLAALPYTQQRKKPLRVIPGSFPAGNQAPTGCAFAARCPQVMGICRQQQPPLFHLSDDQRAACFLHERLT